MLTKKNVKKYQKKTLKYKKDSKQKTFYVRTKDERINLLIENLLEKYGYKKGSKFPVDFVFIANNYLLYKYKVNSFGTEWINNIYGNSMRNIVSKMSLYKKYGKMNFCIPTIFIENNIIPKLPSKFIKIIKPTAKYAGSGMGIGIVRTKKDVIDWINKYPQFHDWLLQKYILNSDLYLGYKFHFRVNLVMILKKKLPKELYIANKFKILTSLKPYNKNIITDKGIFDSHLHGRNINDMPYFPDNLPDKWTKKDADKKINEIINIIKIIFKDENDFQPEWGAINGFYLFGADFMFENKKTYLLEINDFTGIPSDLFVKDQINLILNKPQSTFERIL